MNEKAKSMRLLYPTVAIFDYLKTNLVDNGIAANLIKSKMVKVYDIEKLFGQIPQKLQQDFFTNATSTFENWDKTAPSTKDSFYQVMYYQKKPFALFRLQNTPSGESETLRYPPKRPPHRVKATSLRLPRPFQQAAAMFRRTAAIKAPTILPRQLMVPNVCVVSFF